MTSNKHIDAVCIAITILAIIITILFFFGDKLGIASVVDEDDSSYNGPDYVTKRDLNYSFDIDKACKIVLNDNDTKITGDGAYIYNDNLVIAKAGAYAISGVLKNGSIIVDAGAKGKVYILFDGVNIYSEDSAAFKVANAGKVFITLADNSENELTSGENYSEDAVKEKISGTVFSHDNITINGRGALLINGNYKHGIDANDKLTIAGGNITINSKKDALHANENIAVVSANITIATSDDGISTKKDVNISDSNITINDCYEGIEAANINVYSGNIVVYARDDGFNARIDGLEEIANNKTIMQRMEPPTGKPDGHISGNGISKNVISENRVDDKRRPEAENHDRADIQITDNAIQNIEKASVHIYGGNIMIINNSSADADGIDANGDIIIEGGNILVSLINNGLNNALDYGSEIGGVCEITGGTVVACGSYAMAEGFCNSSSQPSILYTYSKGTSGKTTVKLLDMSDKILISTEVPYSFSSVILSCQEIKVGNEYKISFGDNEAVLKIEEMAASYGDVKSTRFDGKMNWGNMQPPKEAPAIPEENAPVKDELLP